jgi:hypothetical protein
MNPRVKEVIPLPNYQLQHFNQVKILDGTVTWPNEQDICPDSLYLDSISQT